MKKIILFFFTMVSAASTLWGQSSANLVKTGGTYYHYPPVSSGYYAYMSQWLYEPSDFGGNPIGGLITKIYVNPWYTDVTTITGFEIQMGQTTQTNLATSTAYGPMYSGQMTTVYSGNATFSHTASTWLEIPLQTPFAYDPTKSIVIQFKNTTVNSTTGNGLVLRSSNQGYNPCKSMYYWAAPYTSGYPYPYLPDMGMLVVQTGTPQPPIPLFYTPASICQSSPQTLVNNSILTGYNISYQWSITPNTHSFVNGTTPTSKNPVVAFNSTGNYTIKLKVTNNIGSDSITKMVPVTGATVAAIPDFVAPRRLIPKAVEVTKFTDLSGNCPQLWRWSSPDFELEYGYNPFLDSTVQQGNAFFPVAGSFDICLKAENTVGGSTICKTDYITVVEAANLCNDTISRQKSGFIYDEGTATNSYYNNRSLNNCKGFVIDPCASSVTLQFEQIKLASGAGDSVFVHNGNSVNSPLLMRIGSNMNGQTPTVTANSGKMFIYMVTNASVVDSGIAARWSSVDATYGKPTASFSLPSSAGLPPKTYVSGYPIKLTSTSTGVDISHFWDVTDDGTPDSTKAVTTALFYNFTSNPEQHTIMLIASNCKGADTTYETITIVPLTNKPNPINFVANKLNTVPSDTVRFTDLSVGATSWEWTFTPNAVIYYNGTNKYSQHPIIGATGAGCLHVKLKASNAMGVDSLLKPCYINMVNHCPPGAGTTLSPDLGISKVVMGAINNTTSVGAYEYQDFYDSSFASTVVYRGQTNSITISRLSNNDFMTRRVWVDFNGNGSFLDAGEMVVNEQNSKSMVSTFQFTIPLTANLGPLKMRVGAGDANSFLDPCAVNVGEFEDYKLIVGVDETAPVITVNGADTVYVEINSTYTDGGATAFDNLEGNITPKIVSTNNIDMSSVGYYQVWYNVTDNYGNKAATKARVVVVQVDRTAPEITLNGNDTVYVHVYSKYTDAGAVATDNYSGNITAQMLTINPVDTATLGQYVVNYVVRDFFGFTSAKQRLVIVNDTVKPVLTGPTGNFTHSVKMPIDDKLVVTATDNYYKNLVPVRTGTVDVNTLGCTPVTYNLTDGSGNVAQTLSVTICVADTTKPTINMVGADTLQFDVYTTYVEPMPAVSDNFYSGLLANKTGSFDRNNVGTYTITYSCTDGSGNTATRTRVIKIVDRVAPVINILGAKVTEHCQGHPFVDLGVQVIDNYYSQVQINPFITTTTNLNVNMPGLYKITYGASDPSGNIADPVERLVEVSPCAGIGEPALNGSLNVYPNPSRGLFNLDITLANSSDVTIRIYDVLGNELKNITEAAVTSRSLQFDLNSHPAGLYFINVSAGGQTVTRKINLIK